MVRTKTLSPLLLSLVFLLPPLFAHQVDDSRERLAEIGPAADFELIAQDGKPFSLRQVRGKVVAVSFTFTSCTDVCPILISSLVSVQQRLGEQFGSEVYFVTVSMDPETDRPERLKQYAEAMGCDLRGWSLVTGRESAIQEVARDYGVFRKLRSDGRIEHTLLTSIIDRNGTTRVQYLGNRFDTDEFLGDLQQLINEEDRG